MDKNLLSIEVIGLLFGASFVSFLIGIILRKFLESRSVSNAKREAERLLADAAKEAEAKVKEGALSAKDELYKARLNFEKETKERRQELLTLEKRVLQKETNLDRKVDTIDKKELDLETRITSISDKENAIEDKEKELNQMVEEEKQQLQRISGLNPEEAKELYLKRIEDEVTHESAALIRRIENEAKITADKKAKDIVGLAIQRCGTDYCSEITVSTVPLPSDEMKGRIIGREGRNIRAFETATGIDVIIDDTPEAVVLSGFDPVKRQIARMSLEKLISDGRIHPARIEEVVEKVKKEMDEMIQETGEQAVFDLGISGVHIEIIKLLGRLRFRTSYGQNVLQHSKETAYVMGIMASELGLNVQIAKRAGLLHDIGKAVDHEIEGSHAVIGADLAKKYGEIPAIVHAIRAHHEDEEQSTLLAVLTQSADAISGARPGARCETLEAYVKRLETLENIATSFKGVDKSFAIQAGREVRVMVQPEKIGDNATLHLARDITKKIEAEMDYPGQIKVTVIRETRSVEYAK